VSPARILSTVLFLFLVFAVQESAVSLIHFPITGFSLYVAVAISLIASEDHNGSLVMGFLAGIVLDLSPTSDSPFGQWALVFTVIGYLFAVNKESIADFTSSPITFVLLVAVGTTAAFAIDLGFGALLGEEHGSIKRDLIISVGNGLWTIIFAPIFLPGLRYARRFSLTPKER
jgi:rod shape-determining protein MreD